MRQKVGFPCVEGERKEIKRRRRSSSGRRALRLFYREVRGGEKHRSIGIVQYSIAILSPGERRRKRRKSWAGKESSGRQVQEAFLPGEGKNAVAREPLQVPTSD